MGKSHEHIEQEDFGTEMKKPFNPNNIKVRFDSIPVYSIAERLKHHEIKLNTEFQRKEGLWKDEQQSRFIESILIRFPVPVFYFDGSNPDQWLVIDGLQRLTTIKRFMNSKDLKLIGLEFLTQLEGFGWDDLTRPQQRQINETSLQCHILEEGEDDVKFNIFKRINTGGLYLSDQEIRHAMHQEVSGFLQDLAESSEFVEATRGKVSPERMLDRDFVNRFLAFYLFDYNTDYTYEDDLDTFMNKALEKVSTFNEKEKRDIEIRFKKAMTTAKEIFGESAFCKQKDYKRINKALFEVISVTFAGLDDNQRAKLILDKQLLKQLFYKAISTDFGNSLTSNTGGKSNVSLRHSTFKSIIHQVLNS